MTLYGPHRDDFCLKINNEDIKVFGSQGQQKIAFLAIKFSEIKLFDDINLTKPIILLDDVFSELDRTKKNKLIKYIDTNYQLIITTNDLKDISKKILKDAKIFKISNNKIIEEGGIDNG
jgi:DNA replication and repair protein RecF